MNKFPNPPFNKFLWWHLQFFQKLFFTFNKYHHFESFCPDKFLAKIRFFYNYSTKKLFVTISRLFCFSFFVCCDVIRSVPHMAHNGEAAWRRRGEHYRSLEPQTVNSPRNGLRSYTPAWS